MAKLVLGIGTSHTPMLNAPAEDWPRFIDRDAVRDFLDKEGQRTTYEELLDRAEPHVAAELTPERFAARHAEAQAGVAHLRDAVRPAELADAAAVLQARPGDPGGGRGLSGQRAGRHRRLRRAEPLRRRRRTRPRRSRRMRSQGCRCAAILAPAKAQFRQLGDPDVDL